MEKITQAIVKMKLDRHLAIAGDYTENGMCVKSLGYNPQKRLYTLGGQGRTEIFSSRSEAVKAYNSKGE
jgi:hypothetical protein